MINLKPDVVSALKNDPTLTGLLGGQRIYFREPPDMSVFPRVTYYEADNREFPFGDELEASTEVVMVIDVWNTGSTSAIAQTLDSVMSGLGFYREYSADLEYDSDVKVHRKHMRYRKLKVFDGDPGVSAVDTWLEALALWTETKLGAGWTVYRNAFPPGYNRPAVIWVLTNIRVRQKTSAVFTVQKRFLGIALGSVPNQQHGAALSIVEGLGSNVKIVLDAVNRRYLTVNEPAADIRADALTAAQVSIVLTRSTNRPTEEIPYIMQIEGSGTLS